MYRSKNVFPYNAVGNYDGILKVITFPGHKSNHQVTAQGKFAILGSIAFAKHLTLGNFLTLMNRRPEVHTSILVGTCKFD